MLSDFLREKLSVDVFDKDTLTADDPLGGCAPLPRGTSSPVHVAHDLPYTWHRSARRVRAA